MVGRVDCGSGPSWFHNGPSWLVGRVDQIPITSMCVNKIETLNMLYQGHHVAFQYHKSISIFNKYICNLLRAFYDDEREFPH